MEQTVPQTVKATVGILPGQASSTASRAANAISNGSTEAPPTVKPMEVQCDAAPPIPDQPTTSEAPTTRPAKILNDVKSTKSSPSKSHSRQQSKKQARPKNEQEALDTKVEVAGYPTFAKPQDLHKIFSAYGNTRVEHMGRRFAVVAFENKEIARAVLYESMQLCLYGQFLTIKPFGGVVDEQKRQVFKSKHTVVVVEPNKIALTGTFGEQLAALLAAVRLTQHEVTALATLYGDLERVMQTTWPGCQAMPFGSITTGLGVKSSDADCFMNIPPQYRYGYYNFVNKAKRILQQYPDMFAEVFAIPRANTPIVKLFHLPTKTHCDLTFKTPLGALNSKLVAFLLHADPRLLPLAVVVKYWASVHGISGSGKLTNYALTLMLIFYLQTRGILPAVAWLQQEADPIIVDGWNTGFVEDPQRFPKVADDASIEELLGGFFKFYDTFDFETLVACPYLGRTIEKARFVDSILPDEFQRYKQNVADNLVAPLRTKVPVCVQDPFEQCHNVASSVTSRMAEDIRVYIRFAAEFYEKDKANGCQTLLRTILLEKPKLVRAKTNPEYRITLYPKILDTIVHEDWQGTFRKTIFTIFERMLKLKLAPTGEKETARNGRVKEKYLTSMNKPLWKRRQFSRLHEILRLGFIERHARVTEEIINSERTEWVLEFQVILSFCTKYRNAWVSIRLTNGDMDAFYQFGKYFLATMQNWFLGVLQASHDTSAKENLSKQESIDATGSGITANDNDRVVDEGGTRNKKISKEPEDSQIDPNAVPLVTSGEAPEISSTEETLNKSHVDPPEEVPKKISSEATEESTKNTPKVESTVNADGNMLIVTSACE